MARQHTRAIAITQDRARALNIEGYDGQVHGNAVFGALMPAALILIAATVLMLALL